MNSVFEIVSLARRKNKLKRELLDNEKKVRDNRKRVDLLENLVDYIKPDMTQEEIIAIVKNMKADYEDRVDDPHHQERRNLKRSAREISRRIRELTEQDKLMHPRQKNKPDA
ncbi:DUF496 family protein [Vibrio fluvialis]|uniref:DUF496 family protein n=1 Tax=Vibrio fluvialis TaxID=676 RepID=UPI001EEC59FD|nr:DUF496 family protein [Vibrio fluvialis]MCG6398878.1 DUF496 family protein [Vibrio fluvialis]